jgi:hypothetical protein
MGCGVCGVVGKLCYNLTKIRSVDMQTIQINNAEAQQYIQSVYGDNQSDLVNDFLLFIKSEIVAKDLKKGFDEVEDFKAGKIQLSDANDFLSELKRDY